MARTRTPVYRKIFAVLFAAGALNAQTFEVASVKRLAPESGSGARSTGAIPRQQEPARINYPHVSLQAVLTVAYGVDRDQVSGPQWLDDERYDIVATLPAGSSQADVPIMLRHLLADRFRLTVREATQSRKGFALVAGKGAPKLTRSKPNGNVGFNATASSVTFTGSTMAGFAKLLSRYLGAPVADETNMDGEYDLTVNVSMDDLRNGGAKGAVEDLGLKLEPRTMSVKSIAVEKADRIPTAN